MVTQPSLSHLPFVSQSEASIAFFLTLTHFLSLSLANLYSLHLLHMFHPLCPNTFFYKELHFPLATRRIIKIPILLMSLAFFFHCKVIEVLMHRRQML